MPIITTFYGIIIRMNLKNKEHGKPHIHAEYQEDRAVFSIENGEILAGIFRKNGTKLVQEYIQKYKKELLKIWNTQEFKRLPPLDK